MPISIHPIKEDLACWRSLLAIIKPLNPANEEALRDYMPGVWPTIGDLKTLVGHLKKAD